MRDKRYSLTAIVLKRVDIGEADRLLTLLTAERGKVRVVAKGARKPSTRKTGHVELFNHVALLIAAARSIDLIIQAETIHAFIPLRSDLDRLAYAYYFAELADRFVEEGIEHPELYRLVLDALRWLAESPDVSLTARYFEMQLLGVLGYRPQLSTCIDCREELLAEENYFTAEGGGMLNGKCRASHPDAVPASLNALKVLRFLQNRSYPEAARLRLSAEVAGEVEGLMKQYINHHLERRLKSVELLDMLRQRVLPTSMSVVGSDNV